MIAAALTGGALLGAILGPPGGRLVDRVGAGRVGLAMGLAITAFPIVLAFGLPEWGQLAMLVLGGPVFAVAASAMYPLASAGADRAGIAHVAVNGPARRVVVDRLRGHADRREPRRRRDEPGGRVRGGGVPLRAAPRGSSRGTGEAAPVAVGG